MTAIYAHSVPGQPPTAWEMLFSHLEDVARRAATFGAVFGACALARVAALLHDFGKVDPKFQKRLGGSPEAVDHATPGAVLAAETFGQLGSLLAAVIAGHHTGLRNDKDIGEDLAAGTSTITRIETNRHRLPELRAIAMSAGLEIPEKVQPPRGFRPRDKDAAGFCRSFLTRMVFSALVDADFLATEEFYLRGKGRPVERGDTTPLAALREALDSHLAGKMGRARTQNPGVVTEARAEILAAVRSKAGSAPGAFTLTVPTGGGKTLASLAFALDHAIAHDLDRVIVVIPFTSIVEQTAEVFRVALAPYSDSVVEHHSAFDEDKARREDPMMLDKLKLAAENWDGRIIVTTAVQFFESLFANRVSKCRKLHNVARSIVVLDEAQTLPVPLLLPTLAALDELTRNYSVSLVLSTATQPAVTEGVAPESLSHVALEWSRDRELAPEPQRLFEILRRVTIVREGRLSDEAIAVRMAEQAQVLTIVNTRKHARALFERIRAEPGARHLSTFMVAAHRSEVLASIRADLAAGRPCCVASTSLIEAGVDVDFPFVMRAEAGLEQIAQAAGRCNREGRRSAADSHVVLFEVDKENFLPALGPNADAMRAVLRAIARGELPEGPLSPAAMESYFGELLGRRNGKDFDEHDLMRLLSERAKDGLFPFETVAKRYKLIEDGMLPIIHRWNEEAADLVEALTHADHVGGIARKLQRYVASVPRRLRANLIARGAARVIQEDKFGDQFVILEDADLYRADVGLDGTDPTFTEAGRMVV